MLSPSHKTKDIKHDLTFLSKSAYLPRFVSNQKVICPSNYLSSSEDEEEEISAEERVRNQLCPYPFQPKEEAQAPVQNLIKKEDSDSDSDLIINLPNTAPVTPFIPGFYKEITELHIEEPVAKDEWPEFSKSKIDKEYSNEEIYNIIKLQKKSVVEFASSNGIYFNRNEFSYGDKTKIGQRTAPKCFILATRPLKAKKKKANDQKWSIVTVTKSILNENEIREVKCPSNKNGDAAIEFFIKYIIIHNSFHSLQASFSTIVKKLREFCSPLPSTENLARIMVLKMMETYCDRLVYERNPNEFPQSMTDLKMLPPQAEAHRKLLISVEYFVRDVEEYKSLPRAILNSFKNIYTNASQKIKPGQLVPMGRIIGELLSTYFDCSTSISTIYHLMLSRPNFVNEIMYGMICSFPEPYTMAPFEFDYNAVSLRDRSIYFIAMHRLIPIRLFLINNLKHPSTLVDMQWTHFLNFLVSELSDFNFEYRRKDAAQALELVLFYADPTDFLSFVDKMWETLMTEYKSKSYKMDQLLAHFIYSFCKACTRIKDGSSSSRWSFLPVYLTRLDMMLKNIGEFLQTCPVVTDAVAEIFKGINQKNRKQKLSLNDEQKKVRKEKKKEYTKKRRLKIQEKTNSNCKNKHNHKNNNKNPNNSKKRKKYVDRDAVNPDAF